MFSSWFEREQKRGTHENFDPTRGVVHEGVGRLWDRTLFNGCLDDQVNSRLQLTVNCNIVFFCFDFVLGSSCHCLPAQVEEDAKYENNQSAVQRELKGGGDVGWAYGFIQA